MMELEFEWHDAKAEANLQAHGVSFDLAKTVFKDPLAVELVDDRENYGEERLIVIGMAAGGVVLFVAFTEREGRVRIVSARRATQNEQDDYFRQGS
ncbi:MAG: BrnT family toxin [Bryobacteraceae bacterium]